MAVRGQEPGAPPRGAPVGKISVPSGEARVLPRPRCSAALAEACAEHDVVLVTAPAGYGKTTLLAEWARQRSDPVVWVSLDTLDDDPRRLARVLTDAVLAAYPHPGSAVPTHAAQPVHTVAEHVDALVVAAEHLPPGTVLVLDDVHELSLTTGRQVLAPLLRYPGVRLVLAARHDSYLPVNRLRVSGRLGEVRLRTLAFTPEEILSAADQLGTRTTPDAARALWEITGGWPVAVRLAIAAGTLEHGTPMQQLRDRDVPLTGYLVDEIVGALQDDLASFVLRASFAAEVDPETAEALQPGGAALLEQCVARDLFLTETASTGDDAPPSYRWHALVAAHARAVLTRRDPAAAREAHRVVAVHLAAADPAAAIQHALDGRAPELAATILGERWPDLIVRGEAGLVQRLRDALPAPHRHQPDVQLALTAARALDVDVVVGGAGAGAAEAGQAAVVDALASTFLAPGRPALEESVRRGRAVLETPGLDDATTALGLYLLGRAELQQYAADPGAAAHVARAGALARAHGWTALELGCRAESSLAAAHRGAYTSAAGEAAAVLGCAAARGWSGSSVVATAHLAAGLASYWTDDLEQAHAHLAAAIAASGRLRPEVAVHAAGVLAIVCLAQGDAAGLGRARQVVAAPWGEAQEPEHQRAFRRFLVAVELDHERRPDEALTLVVPGSVAFEDPLALTWRSDALRRTGDDDGARRALLAARAGVAATGRPPLDQVVVAVESSEALLRADAGDGAGAHAALERALAAASREGVVRPLRDRAPDLHPLLSEHLAWGSRYDALVARLLAAERALPVPRASAWDLTARERDVLVCLRSPLTAEEIAGSMFVSINTVKSHLRAIYRKLGVDGRREAVREAVQRGMI